MQKDFPQLANLDEDSRIYLRPIQFIESPQQHDGQAAKLAGTMLWFSGVEIVAVGCDGQKRFIVPVAAWDGAVAALPGALAERAQKLFANITSPRPPLILGERTIRLDQPQVMGIINMTPDSFSDGGKHDDNLEAAAEAALAMASAGAAIIDIGGESTRPGAKLVWEGDEIKRVEPLIQRLASTGTAISIDTRKAAVMQSALAAGAHMVNDISALLYDDQSGAIVQQSGAAVVLMHAPSQSSDPHKDGSYDDVVTEVYDFLEARVEACVTAGIAREKIIVDPGLGFGKSLADNLALVNNLAIFHGLGCPILFGASRKRMIGALSNEAEAGARLGGSIFLAMKAVEQGAQIVRMHDVPEAVQAIRIWRGLRDAALTARA
ncbi:MAG: dihydropteroate synthase [Sphingorhabdus sp.]